MKVLHVCTLFWPNTGGTERFVLDLARHSRARGIDASVLCHDRVPGVDGRLPANDEVDGIPIRRVPYLDLKYYKPTIIPVDDLRAADVVHVHGTGAPLDYCALTQCLYERPLIVSTHGGISHTQRLAGVKSVYNAWVQPHVLAQAARVVACSRGDMELFRPLTDRLVLIENGVETAPLLQAGAVSSREPNRFLFVGRISESKCIDDLLRCFRAMKDAGASFSLRVIGPDPYGLRGKLEALSAELKLQAEVKFVGEISEADLIREYASAAFFASASRHEGFGLSAVEAMAGGCVAILNNIPAFRYLVGDSRGAVLVNFADPARAAIAVTTVVNENNFSVRRQQARDTASRYSWEAVMPRWVEIYTQAMRRDY